MRNIFLIGREAVSKDFDYRIFILQFEQITWTKFTQKGIKVTAAANAYFWGMTVGASSSTATEQQAIF